MKKANRENLRVRQNLRMAMLKLLKQKSFSEITVTDLIENAGVGRTSYYRNYSTKEDIIVDCLVQIQEKAKESLRENSTVTSGQDFVARIMESLKLHKEDVLTLYNAGFYKLLLELITENIEFVFGDMPTTSINKYKLPFLAGAIFNTEIAWLKSGAKEDCASLAELVCNFSSAEFFSDSNDISFAIFDKM